MFKELKILSIQGTNNLISKWADELNGFHMKKHKGPIHIGEKTFNIFSHQRNANQHHIWILSHPSQKGYNQRNKTATNVGKDGGGKRTYTLMLGMRTKAAATEVSVESLYNTTHTVATWSSYGGVNEMAPEIAGIWTLGPHLVAEKN